MRAMKKKPLIFTMLSILFLIEPLIKVLYFKAKTHFAFDVIFSNIQARNSFFEVVDFWLIFPIAGILILKLRKWTYFAFMSIMSYIIYSIITYEQYTWPYNSESPFLYHYVVALLALVVFVSFLFPQLRRPFFDSRLRWWEPPIRYQVEIPCRLHSSFLTYSTHIINISRTGAFLQDTAPLKLGDKMILEFNFLGHSLDVPVIVIHQNSFKGVNGFGVKFLFKNYGQSLRMAKIIGIIKKSHGNLEDSTTSRYAV